MIVRMLPSGSALTCAYRRMLGYLKDRCSVTLGMSGEDCHG